MLASASCCLHHQLLSLAVRVLSLPVCIRRVLGPRFGGQRFLVNAEGTRCLLAMMESGWSSKWRMYTDGRFAKSSKVATIKPTRGNAEVSFILQLLFKQAVSGLSVSEGKRTGSKVLPCCCQSKSVRCSHLQHAPPVGACCAAVSHTSLHSCSPSPRCALQVRFKGAVQQRLHPGLDDKQRKVLRRAGPDNRAHGDGFGTSVRLQRQVS